MHKFKSYISVLFLALLLFPIADKVMHELEHLNDSHCAVKETHFCEKEHNCSICDYIFSYSAAAITPNEQEQLSPFFQLIDTKVFNFVSNTTLSQKYTLSLRGPPIA